MIRIVRLGSTRSADEGLRIGTVRRPPRGVPKTDFSRRDFYDVWLPTLAPSEGLLKRALSLPADDAQGWKRFERAYRREMKAPDVVRLLETFAALSQQTNFSMGCYCQNEARCHRSILRDLLTEHGALIS